MFVFCESIAYTSSSRHGPLLVHGRLPWARSSFLRMSDTFARFASVRLMAAHDTGRASRLVDPARAGCCGTSEAPSQTRTASESFRRASAEAHAFSRGTV